MGFDFVFEKDKEQSGYNLCGVKGIKDGGEYDLLEIPSRYAGLPVIGIKRLFVDNWNRYPTHIKHVILPETLGYFDPDIDVQNTIIDTLTVRGWVPKYIAPLWKYYWSENAKWLCAQRCPFKVITLIFEKGEIPPHFFLQHGVRHVTIGNGVTQIGPRAFEQTCIERVKIPSSVLHIGEGAFRGAPLTEVTLSEGLQSIGTKAFLFRYSRKSQQGLESSIKHLSIPSTVKEIGAEAFDVSIVDRNSMKGRDWRFEVPSRFRYDSSQYYSTRRIPDVNAEEEKSAKRNAENASSLIKIWLDAEDPGRLSSSGGCWNYSMNRKFSMYDLICGYARGRMFSTGHNPCYW